MAVRNALIAGAFFALGVVAASPASAADPYYSPYDGGGAVYAGLRGSIVDGDDTHTTSGGVDLRAHYGTGYGLSAFAGLRLPYGFRVEGELMYRHFALESLNIAGVPQAGRSGYLQIAAPMANVFWDIPFPNFVVHPFIGAGVGGAYLDAHSRVGAAQIIGTDKWSFAYQLMGGVVLPLSTTARLTSMYRYFRVQDGHFRCAPPALPVAACDANVMNQSIDLGIEFDI